MLYLMEWPWVLIGVGVGLVWWGGRLLGWSWWGWLGFLINWGESVVGDETGAERKQREKIVVEEEMAASPGCGVVGLGVVLLLAGVLRVVSSFGVGGGG